MEWLDEKESDKQHFSTEGNDGLVLGVSIDDIKERAYTGFIVQGRVLLCI